MIKQCNWFGSECEDEWTRVTDTSRQRLGALDQITLRMPIKSWRKVLENYRPGSVVRIQTKERLSQDHVLDAANDEDGIFESVFAIAQCDTPGEIQVLVARPDPSLRWEVRRVAELLRATASPSDGQSQTLSDDSHTTPKGHHRPTFYINPAISGFYNSRYEYLMDEVERVNSDKDSGDDREKGSTIEDVVVVATGSGLSGALSAVEALVSRNQSILNKATTKNKGRRASSAPIRIHLYYGLRDVNNLSYADRLGKLVQSGSIQLTLVQSKQKYVSRSAEQSSEAIIDAEKRGQASTALNKELAEAVARGDAIKARIDVERNHLVTSKTEHVDSMRNGKVHVQHALKHDLTQIADPSASLPLEKFAFVVCGRMLMTDDVRAILKRLCRPENEADREGHLTEQSRRMVETRLFVNI
jgi:hypothetical protein